MGSATNICCNRWRTFSKLWPVFQDKIWKFKVFHFQSRKNFQSTFAYHIESLLVLERNVDSSFKSEDFLLSKHFCLQSYCWEQEIIVSAAQSWCLFARWLKKSLATVKKYILKHNFSFLKTVSGLFFKPGRTEDLKNNLKLNVNLGFYSAHLSSHGFGFNISRDYNPSSSLSPTLRFRASGYLSEPQFSNFFLKKGWLCLPLRTVVNITKSNMWES